MKRLALVVGAVLIAAALAATAVTFASSGGTTIDHDGENVTLAAAPGQTVSGQTDLDAGTTLDVRLTSTDASNPFLQTREATVAENGSFATRLDLGAVSPGATATLTVRHNDSVLASESVAVVPCDDDCEPNTESGDRQSGTTVDREGETLTLVSGTASKISGQSDLEPGTELELLVESTNVTRPFLIRESTNVTDNGTFATTVDTHSVAGPLNASVTVIHDEEELTEVDARVVPCDDDCEEQSSGPGEGTPPSEFGLEEDVPVASQNETAEIPVAVGDADTATLSVGDEDDVNYRINATARDENGDGRVVFVLDPAAAGNESTPTMTVRDDGDTVSINSETDVDGPLSPATYDLVLYRGESADGNADDVGALALESS